MGPVGGAPTGGRSEGIGPLLVGGTSFGEEGGGGGVSVAGGGEAAAGFAAPAEMDQFNRNKLESQWWYSQINNCLRILTRFMILCSLYHKRWLYLYA